MLLSGVDPNTPISCKMTVADPFTDHIMCYFRLPAPPLLDFFLLEVEYLLLLLLDVDLVLAEFLDVLDSTAGLDLVELSEDFPPKLAANPARPDNPRCPSFVDECYNRL